MTVFSLAMPASAPAAAEAPQTFVPAGLSAGLENASGTVRVRILLRGDPVLAEALRPSRARVLQGRARARAPAAADRRRTQVLGRIGDRGPEALALQAGALHAIRAAGGTTVERSPTPNSIVAHVPASALAELARHPYVQAIAEEPEHKPLLNIASYATGADTWWNAGHTGGRGASDPGPGPGPDISIGSETNINENSPVFAGAEFLRPDASCVGTDNHGTPVASMAVSQDATYKGIAHGADKVLNACSLTDFSSLTWAVGITHAGVPGATDPAEVINYSHGSVTYPYAEQPDDTAALQGADHNTSTFGVTFVAAAGNDGPKQSVHEPSTAYNAISAAASNDKGTDGFGDDIITDYSSRGPTPGGRKKPDIAAMGGCGGGRCLTLAQGNPPPTFLGGYEGTSFASPHVAAGALLLAGAGIADPKAQKAILIDSAYPFAGQTTWRDDSGWGIMDLDTAYAQRNFYASSTVLGESAKFYSASIANGDKATLTWFRRAIMPNDPYPPVTAYTFSNLDLVQYNATTQAQQQISSSPIDSVEQVRSTSAGNVIYKVDAVSSVDGTPSEPYAIAASKALTALDTPTVTQTPSISTSEAKQNQDLTIQVTAQNAGELVEQNAYATLAAPAGIEIVSGEETQQVSDGTLSPDEQGTVTWTIHGMADGTYSIPVTATATGWGETFQSQSSQQLTIDSTPPSATLSALDTYTTDTSIDLSWSGSDGPGVGIGTYDVEVREAGATWQNLLTDTSQTSTTYEGQDGHTYEFRTKAADGLGNAGTYPSEAQAQTTVDTQPPGLTVSGPASVGAGQTATYQLSASDSASGIASLTWQMSGSLPVAISGMGFTVPASLTAQPGTKAIAVSATDGAGRTTTSQVALDVTAAPSPAGPSPAPQKRAANLKIEKARVSKRRVTLRGAIDQGATGLVKLSRVRKLGGKKKARRAKAVRRWIQRFGAVANGRWSPVSAIVAARGRHQLTVAYPGDALYAKDRKKVKVKVKVR